MKVDDRVGHGFTLLRLEAVESETAADQSRDPHAECKRLRREHEARVEEWRKLFS